MTIEFDSAKVLQAKYVLGICGTGVCAYLIIQILFKIELNQFKRSVAPEVEKNLSELTLSTSLSGEDDDSDSHSNKSVIKKALSGESNRSNHSDDSYIRKKRIHKETKIGIFLNVALVTFVNYLLMVFLPSGAVPSLIAMTILSVIILRGQLVEDLRRKRLDRIFLVFTLLIFMASFLSLSTYAHIGKKEGGIYEGPARIVGYDQTKYNDEGKSATRTDLEVEWGGEWGCPESPSQQCHAFVSGALCEVKENRKRKLVTRKRKMIGDDGETLEETKDYYKELISEQKEFVAAESEVVDEVAEENDLEYVEVLQETEDILQDEGNETETEIEQVENTIEETAEEINEDVVEVETEVESSPNGTVSATVAEEETKDITELENEVAQLEKEIEELEENNVEEEEMEEITASGAEYYAEAAKDAQNKTTQVEKEKEYYEDLADEVMEENDELIDANHDTAEKNEVLEEEVKDVKEYYKEKEANEPKTEEVITVKYYPANVTNATGEYYVTVTETEKTINATENSKSAYTSSMNFDDDYGMLDDFSYSFEDDFFEDEYWSYNWDNAWGNYACNDLFDTDLENIEYDESTPPGDDNFPFVNVFASCRSCKAFLVDYYSTEHFEKIKQYQRQAVTYAGFGFVALFLSGLMTLKQILRPAEENQLDLLMSDGGGQFRQFV